MIKNGPLILATTVSLLFALPGTAADPAGTTTADSTSIVAGELLDTWSEWSGFQSGDTVLAGSGRANQAAEGAELIDSWSEWAGFVRIDVKPGSRTAGQVSDDRMRVAAGRDQASDPALASARTQRQGEGPRVR